MPAEPDLSGVRVGPLTAGETVALTDRKGRRKMIKLAPGRVWHTAKGAVAHDDLIGRPDGVTVTSAGGATFLALRPLMCERTVTMPRGATVVYPKDAAQILMFGDVFPGARVLEAGAGSGALTMSLLRAIGPTGRLTSYERRPEFAEVARTNVEAFLGGPHPGWTLLVADLADDQPAPDGADQVDRAVLDMLAPWDCVPAVAARLVPGGVLVCYVATTTQLGRTTDTIRAHGGFAEPRCFETVSRDWHAEGLAIRPAHSATGHTGFLIIARKLAPGVTPPPRKRRPAPGAYGADYEGPRPAHAETNPS